MSVWLFLITGWSKRTMSCPIGHERNVEEEFSLVHLPEGALPFTEQENNHTSQFT